MGVCGRLFAFARLHRLNIRDWEAVLRAYLREEARRNRTMGQFREKAQKSLRPVGQTGDPADWAILGECPAIREFLCEVPEEAGLSKQTATLLIFVEDGVVKVCMNDRASGRAAWASGAGMGDALLALEESLQAGKADWRRSGQFKGRRG